MGVLARWTRGKLKLTLGSCLAIGLIGSTGFVLKITTSKGYKGKSSLFKMSDEIWEIKDGRLYRYPHDLPGLYGTGRKDEMPRQRTTASFGNTPGQADRRTEPMRR